MNALVPEWLEGRRGSPPLPVIPSAPPVIPSAARDLGWKWLEPFVGKVPRSLRSLGMTWVVAALLGPGLATPLPAHAQSVQPWAGRGAVPRQPATAGRAQRGVAAQAVAMVGLTVSDMDR